SSGQGGAAVKRLGRQEWGPHGGVCRLLMDNGGSACQENDGVSDLSAQDYSPGDSPADLAPHPGPGAHPVVLPSRRVPVRNRLDEQSSAFIREGWKILWHAGC